MFAEVWTFRGDFFICLRRSQSARLHLCAAQATRTRASLHNNIMKHAFSSVVLVGGGECRGQSPHPCSPLGVSSLMPLRPRFQCFIVASLRTKLQQTQRARGGGGRGESLKVGGSPCQVGGGGGRDVCRRDDGMRENVLLFSRLLLPRSAALLSVASESFQLICDVRPSSLPNSPPLRTIPPPPPSFIHPVTPSPVSTGTITSAER